MKKKNGLGFGSNRKAIQLQCGLKRSFALNSQKIRTILFKTVSCGRDQGNIMAIRLPFMIYADHQVRYS